MVPLNVGIPTSIPKVPSGPHLAAFWDVLSHRLRLDIATSWVNGSVPMDMMDQDGSTCEKPEKFSLKEPRPDVLITTNQLFSFSMLFQYSERFACTVAVFFP
jgi:hypothetical protein